MTNVRRKFRNERKVPGLSWGTVSRALEGVAHRFVVSEDKEGMTFGVTTKVWYSTENRQEFPVESRILLF